ncbi:hypothetical protein BJF84_27215 [Rhodococcus sp. CUA-806]|nr:hypothetical protein BJF84_27215 [Rhodococcus sp. CUA-806]
MNLVVGMYGIIKAGGAYVPLDPDHPRERLAYIIGVADPVLVLTDAETGVADVLPGTVAVRDIGAIDDEIDDARLRPTERATRLRPGNTAYVIFTSPSTTRSTTPDSVRPSGQHDSAQETRPTSSSPRDRRASRRASR